MVSWAAVEGATSYTVNWGVVGRSVNLNAPVGMALGVRHHRPHAGDDVPR